MGARYKVKSAWPAREIDREGIVGHVSFAWKPQEWDELQLQTMKQATDDDGHPLTNDDGTKKWTRRKSGEIKFETGGALVHVYDAPIRSFQKDGKTQYFLALDGVQFPRELADAVVREAIPIIAEKAKAERMRDAGADVPAAATAGAEGDDEIPFE